MVSSPIRIGFTASLPVAAAYVPLGAAKAILMIGIGMDWYWPLISALIVYAGSLEYLMISYISLGISLPVAAWTTLLVNFRHIFYGISYPINRHQNRFARLYSMFSLTDEAYVLTALGAGKNFDGKSLLILQGFLQFWWFFGALLGVCIGQFIPESFTGFSFTLTAMFVILSIDSLSQHAFKRPLLWTAIAIIIGMVSEHIFQKNSFLISSLISYFFLITIDYYWLKGHENG